MTEKIRYTDEPLGDLKVIPDFLPSPQAGGRKTWHTIPANDPPATRYLRAASFATSNHPLNPDARKIVARRLAGHVIRARTMGASDRAAAVHAVDTLNDFVGDFVSGVMLLREYNAQYQAGKAPLPLMVTVQKICLSHLVLGLAKFVEFYQRFHQIIPSEHRDVVKGLVRTIERKGVVNFRNKCVGHIWDTDQGRPLIHSEIMSRLEQTTGNDFDGFLKWINEPRGNTFPTSVVSIVETVRDTLMAQHAITPDEVINR
jgi:hypothetical protein